MVLSDQLDTIQIFSRCIYWSAWWCIQYHPGDTIGSVGYPLNIHWVYSLVRLTVHPILSRWYYRISRIPTKYLLGVSIGPPDSPSNIGWMIPSDQPDIDWIFIRCIYRSTWQSIQYWLDDTFRSAGYPLNIHLVYPLVRLTVHPILYGWYCRISWIPSKYSVGVFIGQPDSASNIEVILLDLLDTH